MLIKADQRYILKFSFNGFWRITLCLKNKPYNQVILKIDFKAIKVVCKENPTFFVKPR